MHIRSRYEHIDLLRIHLTRQHQNSSKSRNKNVVDTFLHLPPILPGRCNHLGRAKEKYETVLLVIKYIHYVEATTTNTPFRLSRAQRPL